MPLFAHERRTRAVQSLYLSDPEVIVWWGTAVECAAAIARLERDGALAPPDAAESALNRLSRHILGTQVSITQSARDAFVTVF